MLHLNQCTFTIVQMHNVAHDLRCNSCVNQTHAHDLSIWSICNMTHLRLIRRYLTFNCSYEKQDFGQVRFHNSCFPAWLKTSCRSLLVTVGTEFTWNRSSFFHITLYHSLSWLIALLCNSSVCSFELFGLKMMNILGEKFIRFSSALQTRMNRIQPRWMLFLTELKRL